MWIDSGKRVWIVVCSTIDIEHSSELEVVVSLSSHIAHTRSHLSRESVFL